MKSPLTIPLIITFITFSFVTSVHAQSFILDPGNSKTDTVEAGSSAYMNIDIGFTDTADVLLKWALISNEMPTAWSYSLCDWPNCYPGIPDSGTMDTIYATQISSGFEAFFNLSFSTHDTVDTGTASLYFYDAANPAKKDTISFTLITTPSTDTIPTNMTEISKPELSMYPNPANSTFHLAAMGLTEFQLLNLHGQVIFSDRVRSNEVDIRTDHLPSGTYILRAKVDGALHRRHLIISH